MGEIRELRISEVFPSIQGEGRFVGYPMTFVRVSGCTRSCKWCDTKYHTEGEAISVSALVARIKRLNQRIVCFTGGEPLLYANALQEVIRELTDGVRKFHLETNGDLIEKAYLGVFNYIACSPKTLSIAKRAIDKLEQSRRLEDVSYDIKIVTDLDKVGKTVVPCATMLMPFTTGYEDERDEMIKRRVWEYCVKNRLRYSPRLHIDVWGNGKKGV